MSWNICHQENFFQWQKKGRRFRWTVCFPKPDPGNIFPFNRPNFEEIKLVFYHPSLFLLLFLSSHIQRTSKSQHELDSVFSFLMYVSARRKNQQLLATCDWMLYEALFVVPNCTGKRYLSDKYCRNDAGCLEGASFWSHSGETVVRFKAQGFLRGRLEQIQSLDPTD